MEVIPETVGAAPRAGAWIETNDLKLIPAQFVAAPRAGAWIETSIVADVDNLYSGRAPRGRVD